MQIAEIFIPITLFLVTGFILVTWLYYRSKEKQMMIEKGMSYDDMIKYLSTKRKLSPYLLLKIGAIIICFSIGLAIGVTVDEADGPIAFISFPIIFSIGIGFVLTFFIGKKLESNEQKEIL